MKKLFAVDVKRLLQNKTAIAAAVLAPLVLVLLVSLAVAPYFFSDVRAKDFYVAVYNEDDDPLTITIVNSLIESKSLGGLITTRFVDSEQEGMAAVKDGAAAFIHIPNNMQQTLRGGGSAAIAYYGNPEMPLEDALLFETLSSGTELVSHAQHAVNTLYNDAVDFGIEPQDAAQAYQRMTGVFFASVLERDKLYEQTEVTSPLGGALPVEYYAVSFLILFVALGAMPVARITAHDCATGLMHRQLLSGHTPLAGFASRWMAATAFLFLQYAVLAAALGAIAGTAFSGSLWLLALSGLLLCALVGLCMMLAGLCSKTPAFAVRVSFLIAVALALAGGLLIPTAYMPAVIRDVSFFTPFSAALRLCLSGMFGGGAQPGPYLLLIAAYIALILPLCLWRLQRRTL